MTRGRVCGEWRLGRVVSVEVAVEQESKRGGRPGGRIAPVLVVVIVAVAAVAGVAGYAWYGSRAWHAELTEARRLMEVGRVARACEQLRRMADRRPDDGEVLLLLGECEMARGRREGGLDPSARDAALAAWARVPASSSQYPRAATLRATNAIGAGRYAEAEQVLDEVLTSSIDDPTRYELERMQSLLYRREGRMDDVRRVLRASWCHSLGRTPGPADVLRELWLLDHSPMPVEAWEQRALDRADPQDDRVWLGRANVAILTGRYAEATDWLDRAAGRRPRDPAVWKARLALARGTGDLAGLRDAAAHLAAGDLAPAELLSLRVWIAGRLGQSDAERRELAALIADAPGDAPALERLAVLEFQAGNTRRSEELRRRKAEVDRAQDRIRKLLLEPVPAVHATELAGLSRVLGRGFDERGWSLVAEAIGAGGAPRSRPHDGTAGRPAATFSPALREQAAALSAPFERPADDSGPRLAERLADLLGSIPAAIARGPESGRGEPSSVAPVIGFVDEAEAAGLRFVFDNGQTVRHLLPETMSGGVGLLDYDGDGWLDVYCVQGGPLFQDAAGPVGSNGNAARDRLFRNRGNGTFEDATELSRIAAIAGGQGYGLGVAVGDYDNDGDPDLFVTRVDAYALYRNRGDGTFEDVTDAVGLSGHRDNPSSSAFADLDSDGDLDLYVCHYMKWDSVHPPTCTNERGEYFYCDPSKVEPAPDHAFRNDAGRFVDVTGESGLAETSGRGLGVVACDIDDDRRIDLYIANDGTANYLYHNRGSFQFEEIALEAGVAGSASGGYQAGMGVACGDIDGDGRPDLLVTNFYGEGATYHHNLGQRLFDDRSAASGLGLATRYLLGFGIALADVGNVGRPDVLIVNGHVNDNRPNFPYAMPARLYANRPDGRLVDISKTSGACWSVLRVARGLAAGDVDNDGRPDAVILPQNDPLEYFHNRSEHVGRFLTIGLEGARSNRDGVGARVTVEAGGRRQVAWRIGGGSYQSAGDPRLHFGLGGADRVESVEVLWPSGQVDRHSGLKAGMGYLLHEGDARVRSLKGWNRAAARPSHPSDSSRPN